MEPQLHVEKPTIKLDLGGGQNVREGFDCVDIMAGAKHQVNLVEFPWPFETDSVTELHSSHFIEHIPMKETTTGKDWLFAFFDECYRILVPGGVLSLVWPCNRSDRAFQDPTHRRFIPNATMFYMNKAWRDMNKLDHYNVQCDFELVSIVPIIPAELTLLHPEAQARRVIESWNTVMDWQAVLKKPEAKK